MSEIHEESLSLSFFLSFSFTLSLSLDWQRSGGKHDLPGNIDIYMCIYIYMYVFRDPPNRISEIRADDSRDYSGNVNCLKFRIRDSCSL